MRILIAEDDSVSRRLLKFTLERWDHEVVVTMNGMEALEALKDKGSPSLAILDWMMPQLDGIDVIRQIRAMKFNRQPYFILLTARDSVDDIVQGLEAGSNDYLTKPFNRNELQARVNAGVRVMSLEKHLADRIAQLEAALNEIRTLKGLIPICSYCKKIREDGDYWKQLEVYIAENSQAEFSHGICPDCYDKFVKTELSERQQKRTGQNLSSDSVLD